MENLKQSDLGPCLMCTRGMMHGGDIQFFRVKIESFIVDAGAVHRQHGLELMMGSPQLARVMGTDPDIAKGVSDVGGLLCQECFLDGRLAVVWEAAGEAADDSDHEGRSTG